MTMLQSLANGLATARHTCALVAIAVAGIVSVTLLYAQVDATEKKAEANIEKIEVITHALNKLGVQQHVIIQQIKDEKEDSKEFRGRTDKALNRILDKLDDNRRWQ